MDGRHNPRSWMTAVLSATTLVTLAGCAGATASGDTSPVATSSSDEQAREYSTSQFAVPLTVSVGSELDGPAPAVDTAQLVYWEGTAENTKVRYLAPVVTYAPGTEQPMAPPDDFVAYLHDQEQSGLELSDETTRTVDGRPATVLTATAQDAPGGFYDGSLGCVSEDTPLEDVDGCFGVQPDLELRLAVVDLGDSTLLAWARTDADGPDPAAFYADFERMLDSIRLR